MNAVARESISTPAASRGPAPRRSHAVLLAVALAASIPACGSTTPEATSPDLSPTPSDDGSLTGTEWVLTELAGEPPVGEAPITLVVDETSAGGNAGCNLYGGIPVVTAGTFRLDEIVATAMACVDARLMDQESDYLARLAQTSTWSVEGGELVLTVIGETLVFRAATD